MKEIYKKLKIIEKKWGIKAWNDICNFISSLVDKINELQKSRDNWKTKYMKLKHEK